jgi:hypothetical protein
MDYFSSFARAAEAIKLGIGYAKPLSRYRRRSLFCIVNMGALP